MSSLPRICNKTADLRGSPAPLAGEQPLAFSLESNFWYAWSATSTTTDDTTATSAAVKPFDVSTGRWLAAASAEGVPLARLVSTTSPLGGGGDLSADRPLTFDATGFFKTVSVACTHTGTTFASTLALPAGAVVHNVEAQATVAYDAGIKFTVGTATHATSLVASADNFNMDDATLPLYGKRQVTSPANETVLVTLSGASAGGAATVLVYYSVPAT